MNGKVSVIIPVYNRQAYVSECIDSILNQSYQNFEIILIDDGSSDQTLAICHEIAKNDSRIKVLEQQHGGVSAARNAGLDAAVGEYVLFVDSDDVIHPQLMGTLALAMSKTGAGMAGTFVVRVQERNWGTVKDRLKRPGDPGETEYKTNPQALKIVLTQSSPLGSIGGVMIRQDLIGETRFRTDLFIGEDFFFIYENLIKGPSVEFLKQKWYYGRLHESNSIWNFGYDGFYTRFLRRKLVWESEEALGRPEYTKLQKIDVLSFYLICSGTAGTSKEDRKKMQRIMKQYRKTIVPALSTSGKLKYYLSVYTPPLYPHKFFVMLANLKKKSASLSANKSTQLPSVQTTGRTKTDVESGIAADPNNHELLNRFLSMSVSSAEQVFAPFEELPGSISGKGESDLERYVYVPGSRQDRILLVAHADTVWDTSYGNAPSPETSLALKDGIFYSTDPKRGIGADDRAGCAMLFALRDSGHSLLVLGGEEHGKKGARYLRKHNPELFKELNRHRFMIEFDWCGTNGCLFNQVDNTDSFKRYIEQVLGFEDSKKSGGCDLQVLCKKVCGVNVGVGNHAVHSPKETLVLAEWENTYHAVSKFLKKEHPRFPIHKGRRLLAQMKWLKGCALATMNRIKKQLFL